MKTDYTNVDAYPLAWPLSWPRTPSHTRQRARFGSKDSSGSAQRLSVHKAVERVLTELDRMTRPGHAWRVARAAEEHRDLDQRAGAP